MSKEVNDVWMVDYHRSAFSRSRPGSPERDVFGEKRGDELFADLMLKLFDGPLADKGITMEDVDEALLGCAMGVYENWSYGGRGALFLAGFPMKTAAQFIDRACGSAGTGLANGFLAIQAGYHDCILAGGYEHMTRVALDPRYNKHIKPNLMIANKRSKYYHPEYDIMTALSMIATAQKLFEEELPTFSKEDLDKFGVRAHNLAIENREWLKGEIVPIEGHEEGNVEETIMVDHDMAPRKTTLEKTAGLRPVSKPFFLKKNGGRKGYQELVGHKNGVITPGNASPLNAGATSCVLMNAKVAEKRGIEPLCKIISYGVAGVDPSVMGRGPVPASKMALKNAGLTADEIDFWEINEAFCVVALNCMNKLGIPEEKVNIRGGSTAIGHPLGATMVRLPGTLARILKDKGAKYGCANACCGGGQGIAVVIENLDA